MSWHPSQAAYPVMWEMRSAKHEAPFATITRQLSSSNQVRYAVTMGGEHAGHFPTGHAAAEFAWAEHAKRRRAQHEVASRQSNGQQPGTRSVGA